MWTPGLCDSLYISGSRRRALWPIFFARTNLQPRSPMHRSAGPDRICNLAAAASIRSMPPESCPLSLRAKNRRRPRRIRRHFSARVRLQRYRVPVCHRDQGAAAGTYLTRGSNPLLSLLVDVCIC